MIIWQYIWIYFIPIPVILITFHLMHAKRSCRSTNHHCLFWSDHPLNCMCCCLCGWYCICVLCFLLHAVLCCKHGRAPSQKPLELYVRLCLSIHFYKKRAEHWYLPNLISSYRLFCLILPAPSRTFLARCSAHWVK